MPVVTMKSLLEAGVHFGHQTRRWNPKMKPYIFAERGGNYIIDLQRTLRELEYAYGFVRTVAQRGGTILFVGTKKQAQEPIQSQAERSEQPYVNTRWLGGMLTNFVTMRDRVTRMEELETMETDGRMEALPKKEQLVLRKELSKLQTNLNGVRSMTSLPGAIFVVDTKREEIAVREAQRLRIPIVGLVDTNADPDDVDYVIPGNDDAIRAVALMCRVIADAMLEGRSGLQSADVPAVVGGEAEVPTVVSGEEAPPKIDSSSEHPPDAADAAQEEKKKAPRKRTPRKTAKKAPEETPEEAKEEAPKKKAPRKKTTKKKAEADETAAASTPADDAQGETTDENTAANTDAPEGDAELDAV